MSVKVTKSDPPESPEILAEAIVRIGTAMQKLKASGLNEDAIIILVQAKTSLPRRDIKLIFDSAKA
jgi:hypothetical protein